jgi:ACS family glucarate transporter-like MFS transporter
MTDATPTHVRYRVIGVCSLMGVLLYLDRFCFSFAEAFIKEDLELTATQISWIFGAFFLSYALGQTPAGWLADRFGGRRMLTVFILAWSLFTGLLGFANGLILLVLLRLGMGFAQAGAYPTAASMISKWAPLSKRGAASSIVALGGRIGGALSLYITAFVILFFVPTTIESKLQPQDILRVDRLCHDLAYWLLPVRYEPISGGLPSELGVRVVTAFPSELSGGISEEATRYQRSAELAGTMVLKGRRVRPPVTVKPPTSFPDQASDEVRSQLLVGLNQVISTPNFFTWSELQELKLEREAKALLKRDQSELSQSEVERMNRLVLEALFPDSIKKVYGAGWPKMAFLYGAIGIPVALLFWIVCRDAPRQHPRCNDAELALIEAHRPPVEANAKVGHLPLWALATNRSMWFNGAMQFFTNIGWIFLVTYLPRYLIEVHKVPVADRALMSTIPTVVAIVGMFMGGFLTDRMVARLGRRWGRSLPIALTRFAAAAAYLLCLIDFSPWVDIPAPWVAIILLSAAAFFCDLGIPAVWAFQQDVGGKHTGSVLGWGNMWGNFGAAAGPSLIAWIAGDQQDWKAVFLTCAAAFALSGLVALGVNATQKVVPDEPAGVS